MARPRAIVIERLLSPAAYPHPVEVVRLVETHISWVLLTGDFAYKIKKPVDFGFLDFSTLERRRHFCREELRLNRRLAADWYLDVVPICGTPEHPRFEAGGTAFDYAVKMRQFPTGLTLKDRVKTGVIEAREIDQVTDLIAEFHARVDRAGADSPYGGSIDIKHWFDENFAHLRPRLKDADQLANLLAIEDWGQKEWRAKADLIERRKRDGFVRECHGDLHLGNMTRIDGRVVLFDCIEFNPMLRWIDVVSEAAFLMIDLLHFKLDALAWRFLNRYLQHTGDYQGIALLRYYLVYRALVLAKVSLLRAEQQHDPGMHAQNQAEYQIYAELAARFTRPQRPMLLITHGFSGSGKSYFAERLAERIGALQLRSDVERKRLHGFGAEQDSGSALNGGIYSPQATQAVYAHLAELARTMLEAGFPVIVDATFLQAAQRDRFSRLAADCGVPLRILDFQTPDEVLVRRIVERQQDASEATVDVLRRQQQSAEPLRPEERRQALAIAENSDDSEIIRQLFSISPHGAALP